MPSILYTPIILSVTNSTASMQVFTNYSHSVTQLSPGPTSNNSTEAFVLNPGLLYPTSLLRDFASLGNTQLQS